MESTKNNQNQKSTIDKSLNDKVIKYETISFNAHPSLTTINFDGWFLRFAPWNTKRANCINPLFNNNDTKKIYEKILECEKIYFSKGKTCIFKINDATNPEINNILSEMDYLNCEINYVMNLNLNNFNFDLDEYKSKKNIIKLKSIIDNKPDNIWLKNYFLFEHKSEKSQKNLINMFNLIKNEQFYVKIEFDEKIVACASCVLEKEIANILNVVCDENFRGRGFGKIVLIEVINEAKSRGAVDSFLYVLKNNKVAINMYESIGFKKVYTYWYRDKKMSK